VSIQLSPVTAAGIELAKIVLGMTAAAILLFLLYLGTMDWLIGADVRGPYEKLVNSSPLAAQLTAAARIDKFIEQINLARTAPTAPWSPEAEDNAQQVVRLIERVPNVPAEQLAQLRVCAKAIPGSDTSRDTTLQACATTLSGISRAAIENAVSATASQIVGEYVGKISEQRQTFHAFWLQGAQLILLNLLLPLLTALFGYIFGTQQSQRAST